MPAFAYSSSWIKLKSRLASNPLLAGIREGFANHRTPRPPWFAKPFDSLDALLHEGQDGYWTALKAGCWQWSALGVRCINQRPVTLPWWWYRDMSYPSLDLVVLHDALACRHDAVKHGLEPPFYGSIWTAQGVRLTGFDRMSDADEAIARSALDTARSRAQRLPGTFFYLGWLANHYGHFLLESLSHVWPLIATPLGGGELRLVAFSMDPDPFFGSPAEALTTALDRLEVDLTGIYPIHGPVIFERLIVPTPSFYLGRKLHGAPVHARVWDAIQRDSYAAPSRAIYLSRKRYSLWGKIRRPMSNEADVESVFRRYGYEIVYPETLSFAEQLALYRQCAVIAGAMGSNVHNGAFMPRGAQSLILAPTSFLTLGMDVLINAPKGNAVSYFLIDTAGVTFDSQESWVVDVDELEQCLATAPFPLNRLAGAAAQGGVA